MKHALLCASFFFNLQITFASVIPTDPLPPINTWPGRMLDQMMTGFGSAFDDAGEGVSASIFEALTDKKVFDFELGDGGSIEFKVQRKVYDNKDITDTWTVIDSFRIPMSLPIPFLNENIFSNGTTAIALGLSLDLEALNIRQVAPSNIKELKKLSQIKKEINQGLENFKDEDVTKLGSQNPLGHARWSKFFNILTHPLRLPLTEKKVWKMPKGEVSSYLLNGTIQLGITVGWTSLNVPHVDEIQVGAGISTYLNGKFRISVLKEKEDIVQLKVTRAHNYGVNTTLGYAEAKKQIFDGFVVLGKTIGDITPKIIPFSLSYNWNMAKQFDVGYRYDLKNPLAVKAYLKATLGRLKISELLSKQKDSGVKKIFTRTSRTRSTTRNFKLSLAFLFEKGHSTSRSHGHALITIDGKKHHIFKAENTNYKGHDSAWGVGESKKYRFYTVLDRDVYEGKESQNEDDSNGLTVKIEGEIDDKNTNSREIIRYMKELEWATGVKNLFKIPPVYDPSLKCDQNSEADCTSKKTTNFKETSWFYRVGYNRTQIETFANFDEDSMWKIIESSFGVENGKWKSSWRKALHLLSRSYATLLNVPLALTDTYIKHGGRLIMAKKFFKRWKKLKEIKNPRNLVKATSRMFRTLHFSREIAFIMRRVLEKEKISYFIIAKAPKLFGSMSKNGYTLADVDTVYVRANDRIEFDKIGARIQHDPKASLAKFDFEIHEEEPDIAEIEYIIEKQPEHVFFRVDKSNRWSRYSNLMRVVISGDREEFRPGSHKLLIKRKGETEALRKMLSDAIFKPRYATLMMALSLKDNVWGAVSSKRRYVPRAIQNDDPEN